MDIRPWSRSAGVRSRRHGSPESRPLPTGRPALFCGDKAAARRQIDRCSILASTTASPASASTGPEARNAIPASGWAELARRCGEAASSGARLLVLAGSREAFCAGADLADFPAFAADRARATAFRLVMRRALDALRDLPIATIAAGRRPLLRRRSRPRHGLRPADRRARRPLRDHPGQVRHLLPAGGRRPTRRPGRAGPGVAAAARRRQRSIRPRRPGSAWSSSPLPMPAPRVDALAAAIRANSAESVAVLKRAIRLAERAPAATRSRTAASTPCSAPPSSASGWPRFAAPLTCLPAANKGQARG